MPYPMLFTQPLELRIEFVDGTEYAVPAEEIIAGWTPERSERLGQNVLTVTVRLRCSAQDMAELLEDAEPYSPSLALFDAAKSAGEAMGKAMEAAMRNTPDSTEEQEE